MTRDLDTLVRDAARIDDDGVHRLALAEAFDDLAATIVAQPAARRAASRAVLTRRLRVWSALGAAAIAAVALVLVLSGRGATKTERAWAAPALRVANALPRYLVGEPGWTVRRADQFSGDDAEMTIAAGRRSVELHWRQGTLVSWSKDRTNSADVVATADVLGEQAHVLLYRGSHDDYTALWRSGRFTMELRAGAGGVDRATFLRVLGSLRLVDVDTWLSAMPASAVKPVDQRKVVGDMLAGVPLPPGLDVDELASQDLVRDRYQLGARVTGAVACGWIKQWADARSAGDERRAQQAVDAMATSHHWKILGEMRAEGEYPRVLWALADAIAGDGTVMGGKPLTVQEEYRNALGCGD